MAVPTATLRYRTPRDGQELRVVPRAVAWTAPAGVRPRNFKMERFIAHLPPGLFGPPHADPPPFGKPFGSRSPPIPVLAPRVSALPGSSLGVATGAAAHAGSPDRGGQDGGRREPKVFPRSIPSHAEVAGVASS